MLGAVRFPAIVADSENNAGILTLKIRLPGVVSAARTEPEDRWASESTAGFPK